MVNNDYNTWGESQDTKERRELLRKQILDDRDNIKYKYNITQHQRQRLLHTPPSPQNNHPHIFPVKSSLFSYLTILFVIIIGAHYSFRLFGDSAKQPYEYTLSLTSDLIRVPVLLSSNGKLIRSKMLVDTGASVVVITKSMLRKLNMEYIMVPRLCKKVITSTANGIRTACLITIKQMQLKRCIAHNVEAIVYIDEEKHSDASLLGMSFLNKFKLVINHGKMSIYC